MSLSEKIYKHALGTVRHPDSIPTKDVKEFIKLLKEFPSTSKFGPFNPVFTELEKYIDKLAGDKLT